MNTTAGAFRIKQIQNGLQDFEMILLFITNYINGAVIVKLLRLQVGEVDVLHNVNGSAVRTQQYFFIQADVGQIHNNRAVLFFLEQPPRQTIEDNFTAFFVNLAFVIFTIKRRPEKIKGFAEAFKSPAIHRAPQSNDLGIASLPLLQHLLSLILISRIFLSLFRK